jgi:hypothetical protein
MAVKIRVNRTVSTAVKTLLKKYWPNEAASQALT